MRKIFTDVSDSNEIIPWSRFLVNDLVVVFLVKKNHILWNLYVHYRRHNFSELNPMMSYLNPVQILTLHLPFVLLLSDPY
jgi:hypothetical protein